MESQLELYKEVMRLRGKYEQYLPDSYTPTYSILKVAFKDGALRGKVKRLIYLAVGIGLGCTNVILGQTVNAIEAGATKEEILETLAVVAAMRGTTGWAESYRVLKIMEEKGML